MRRNGKDEEGAGGRKGGWVAERRKGGERHTNIDTLRNQSDRSLGRPGRSAWLRGVTRTPCVSLAAGAAVDRCRSPPLQRLEWEKGPPAAARREREIESEREREREKERH